MEVSSSKLFYKLEINVSLKTKKDRASESSQSNDTLRILWSVKRSSSLVCLNSPHK